VEALGRLLGANQSAADMLGKSREELVGLLGGEAMECVYARLPGGCGGTVHCQTCMIRRTVSETHADGHPRVDVPATLEAGQGPACLLISTDYRDGLVWVRISPGGG
jgi:PAS domain-containing protein